MKNFYKKIKIKKLEYIFIIFMLLIIQGIFIYNLENILSEKNFFDSYKIINAIKNNNINEYGKSYMLTMKFFSLLRFSTLREYNIFLYSIFFIFFIIYFWKNYSKNLFFIIFDALFIILSAIYLIRPGKEILQFLLIMICCKYPQKSYLLLFLGGILFRKYLLIQGLFFFILKKIRISKYKKYLIILSLIIFLLSSIVFSKQICEILNVRMITNKSRQGSIYAVTIINNILPFNGITFSYINYLINTIRLLFPIELIFKGYKYLSYVVFQLWFTKKLWSWKYNLNDKVILLYSFILVSGIFEPDFGSFLRHTVPYLIVIRSKIYEKGDKK